MIVCNSLANLCIKHGVKYSDLAQFCDVSENTIRRIANGSYIPKLSTAMKICFYFNTSVEEIFLLDTDWYYKRLVREGLNI